MAIFLIKAKSWQYPHTIEFCLEKNASQTSDICSNVNERKYIAKIMLENRS